MVRNSSQHNRSSSMTKQRRDKSVTRQSRQRSSSKAKVIDDDNDGDQGDYLTNTVVAFEEFGESQEVLKLFEFKDKVRTSEQLKRNIVIKIEASTVSLMDVLIRKDLWSTSVSTPYKTGCDLVGRVINIGDRVEENIGIGDLVCALGLSIGGNAKYAIVPSSRAFVCPEDIHPTIAACLVRNYMAAYHCLHRAGGLKIKPGHRVLILGGAGAFGQACIQLAVAAGADEIYATGGSDRSKIIIESLGAQSLGRHPNEWSSSVRGQMDIVIDSVCSDRFRSSHRALNKRGKLVCVGSTSVLLGGTGASVFSGVPLSVKYDMMKATSLMSNTTVYDIFSHFETKRDMYKKDLLRLFHLCRNHEISPKVAYCITLDEVANAHDDLQMGGVADGTIVCLPFGPSFNAKEVQQTQGDDDAIITDYSDGVKLRLNGVAAPLETRVGKVMRDGSFKVRKIKPPQERTGSKKLSSDDESEIEPRKNQRKKKSPNKGKSNLNQYSDDDDDETRNDEASVGSIRRRNNSNSRNKNTRRDDDTATEVDSVSHGRNRRDRHSKPRSKKQPSRGDDMASIVSYFTQQSEQLDRLATPDTDEGGKSLATFDQTFATGDGSAFDQTVLTEGEESEAFQKRSRFRDEDSFADDSYVPPSSRHINRGNRKAGHNGDRGNNRNSSRTRNGDRGHNRRDDGQDSIYGNEQRQSRNSKNRSSRAHGQPPKSNVRGSGVNRTERERGRGPPVDNGRGRSASRGAQPRARSQSRQTGGATRSQSKTRRSSSKGPQQTGPSSRSRARSRSRSKGPGQRSRSRSRSKSRTRSSSKGPFGGRGRSRSRDPMKAKEGTVKGIFSKIKGRARSKSRTRETTKSNLKIKNTRGASVTRRPVSRGPTAREEKKHRKRQEKRENQRRDMMYVEHEAEESSLFPEIEAVRSYVMLKGEDELADEQSEVSWDGTARQNRRSNRESSRGPRRSSRPPNNRQSRSSRNPTKGHSGGAQRSRSQSRNRAPQGSAMRPSRSSSRRR